MPEPLPPPDPLPGRRCNTPLPAYRFVPGLQPHPFRHPQGHLYSDGGPPEAPRWRGQPWFADPTFLEGADLFDHRYLWEAHEVWEGTWRQVPAGDPYRGFLQGLIQGAAALLKHHLGHHGAALRLAGRCRGRLEAALPRGEQRAFGLPVHGFLARLDAALEGGPIPTLGLVLPDGYGAAGGRMGREIRVVAAVVVEGGRVLAARRAPDMARPDLWEFPGGKVEVGEDDAVALARELVEELSLEVEVGAYVGEVRHDYGDVVIRLVAYCCTPVGGVATAHEHSELAWVGPPGLRDRPWAPADVPLLDAVAALIA